MITRDDIRWFKDQFASEIDHAVDGTPFTVDFITAIACQETGPIWSTLRRRGVATEDILATCVGDVIDAPRRRAFPTTRGELVAAARGAEMFAVARQALERMAPLVPGFRSALAQPHKFCRAFGIFQYDLQHFRADPAYFLDERYRSFQASLEKALDVLRGALRRSGLANREILTDFELAGVAIAYNTGRFVPAKGLKQGHFDGHRFYGECIFDFLRLSQTVPTPGAAAAVPVPPPGAAAVPPPTPVQSEGAVFEVDVRDTPLRLRSAPVKNAENVIARLPDGHHVRAVGGPAARGFLEVETSLNGAHLRGFAAREFLVPLTDGATVDVPRPAPAPPAAGIAAVFMPRRSGTVTRRTDLATAHSLNEPGQPSRTGSTPGVLRAELDAIVEYLAVDRAAHRRYQPRDGLTFCNVYAHDYCHLGGAYLPRVWWSAGAIERLALGEAVDPKLEQTIHEQRANDLFRWLRDFGLRFGWRQTGTPSKLQLEVNQGAIGLIVARSTDERRSGHLAVVVPETGDLTAGRDADGEVVAPLQSQAGTTNVRRGRGRASWWTGAQFADSAFWLHA